MSYEVAVVIGLLGFVFLMFYVVSILKDKSEFTPLLVFFFVIGLISFTIIPSSLVTLTDLSYNNGTWDGASYANMTNKLSTSFSTSTYTMWVGTAYVCIYFIYWLFMLFGNIATKKWGKDWKSDKEGGKFG